MIITIEKLIFEGYGLGHVDGKAIFVRKSVPGDELEVETVNIKKNYDEAIIRKIIKPSTKRITPRCPYFDICGGCDHQNISYTDQLKFKDQIIDEMIEQNQIETGERLPIIPGSDSEYFYRNSIRFEFVTRLVDPHTATYEVAAPVSIQIARHNYLDPAKPVITDFCLLQSEFSNELCQSILDLYNNYGVPDNRKLLVDNHLWQIKIREGKQTGEFMLEMITKSSTLPMERGLKDLVKAFPEIKSFYHTIAPDKNIYKLKRRLLAGKPVIYEKIGKYTFQISPESFFQTNSLGVQTLYDQIKNFADIQMGDRVVDLFCGTGSIAIYLSTLAKSVIGVEIVPEAIRDAKDNAKINKISNVEFHCFDVSKLNNETMWQYSNAILVLDPPRAGLKPELIKKICKCDPKRIVYVSCNPATFFRDIKVFNKYGLGLTKLQPIDMFPQTHHIELVGLLATTR